MLLSFVLGDVEAGEGGVWERLVVKDGDAHVYLVAAGQSRRADSRRGSVLLLLFPSHLAILTPPDGKGEGVISE